MKYKVGNLVVNDSHIISTEYHEARPGVKSLTRIITSAVEIDTELISDRYNTYGTGTRSTVIILNGDEADRFWSAYSQGAIDVMLTEEA